MKIFGFVTFTEEILNRKLHFLCSEYDKRVKIKSQKFWVTNS